jgi:hypothetical protein
MATTNSDPSLETVANSRNAVWKPTEKEWVALFPQKPEGHLDSESHLSGFTDAAESDPAAELRIATPVTREMLNRDLAPFPVLRFSVFAELAAGRVSEKAGPLFLPGYLVVIALNGPMYLFNDGRFATKDMVACTIGLAVVIVCAGLPFLNALEPAYSKASEYEQTVAVGYLRWAQALGLSSDRLEEGTKSKEDGTSSRLFEHLPNDRKCPCPLQECAGNLPRRAGRLLVAEKAFRSFAPLYMNLLTLMWTSVVTFGSQTWVTWYWAILGVIALFLGFLMWFSIGTGFQAPSTSLLELTHRLQVR